LSITLNVPSAWGATVLILFLTATFVFTLAIALAVGVVDGA
jgi:hypothetical protein